MTTDFENQVAALEEEKDAALDKVDEKYGALISQSDKFYNDQIDAAQKYADEQKKIQQKQTDFTIGQIQKQKEQLGKDYAEEQSAAYVDFKKQTDPHGVNAERIAAGGMWGSGYSESAQTAMYNEYQRRVATAKASYDQALVNYNNAMAQAQAQNSSVLAEIAYKTFTQELELTMQAFTNRNALLEAQESARGRVESNYLAGVQQLQENRYNVKPSMNDAFTKWVTYLQNEYSDGYVSDAQLWKELVDTYGETALKQAGFSNTKTTDTGGTAIKGTKQYKSASVTTGSSGIVKDGATVRAVNKDDTSSGSGNKSSSGVSVDMDSVLSLGYGPISAKRLNQLVREGIVEEYQSGNKLKFRKSVSTNKAPGLYKSLN